MGMQPAEKQAPGAQKTGPIVVEMQLSHEQVDFCLLVALGEMPVDWLNSMSKEKTQNETVMMVLAHGVRVASDSKVLGG